MFINSGDIVGYVLQTLGLIVAVVACFYTIKTYRKSYDILDVVSAERKYRWNKKELESLFKTLSIDCIDSFLEDPNYFSDVLWKGLRAVDLDIFQFDGDEKAIIVNFLQKLDSFKDLRYEQIPSKHWKFQPLSEKEPFDADKEMLEIKRLYAKARELKPLYNEVKKVLLQYHIDIREINNRARGFYEKIIKEEMELI